MTSNNPSFELMLAKGMRDLDPEDKILQLQVLDVIRSVFERYGYLPIETPLVERMDILRAKFAAGDDSDINKEVFQVTDQGERELGLRYDMTVPLCRYVAMNPTVKMPFKRYVMGKVFRDGPIKLGRYREFWQADADIMGVPGSFAEAEGVLMAADVFRLLELDVTLVFGSRALLEELMEAAGITGDLKIKAYTAIDKLRKIGKEGVIKEMTDAGIGSEQAKQFLQLVDCKGNNQEKVATLKEALPESEALKDTEEVLDILSDLPNLSFEPSLARGMGYYTGFFFEAYLKDSKITSSLIGTGRFDQMVGKFSKGKTEVPGVGFSLGVSVICDAIKEKGCQIKKSPSRAYVVAVSSNERRYALSIAQELREKGINTDMDLLERSIGKNFAYADALGIPYVVVVGEQEQADSTATLKSMESGEQETLPREQLAERLAP